MPVMPDPPRHRLFAAPSPFHALPRLTAVLGGRVELWIKREDLLPIGLGGNKLRNLEFLVGAALAEGADTLITSGRRWSNHARLTAAAGAHAGLAVHLVLSGPPVEPPGPNIRLATAMGATIHQLATADRDERESRVAAVTDEVRAAGGRPFVIGVGGSGAVGAFGQLLAGLEALAQAQEAAAPVDRIVLPSATGGTQAGLLVAMAIGSPRTVIDGVVVARPVTELRPAIATMTAELGRFVGLDVPDDPIRLDERWLGEGYGRRTEAADEATRLLARSEGLLVDPIYTAKALAGLVAGVRAGAWDGQRVLFWHAGGLPGLFERLD
jgi:1-aminocyclopropane-1-carboxylate deaminase/D-cysteine desulfhydrase-like pyridoxal-dependent ACC family enzyme